MQLLAQAYCATAQQKPRQCLFRALPFKGMPLTSRSSPAHVNRWTAHPTNSWDCFLLADPGSDWSDEPRHFRPFGPLSIPSFGVCPSAVWNATFVVQSRARAHSDQAPTICNQSLGSAASGLVPAIDPACLSDYSVAGPRQDQNGSQLERASATTRRPQVNENRLLYGIIRAGLLVALAQEVCTSGF